MRLLDQIQGLWGRTLSPVEIQSIIGLTEVYDDKTILQSAMLALDKEKPFPYMKKVLMNCKKKDEVIGEKKIVRKCKWLEEFFKNLEDEDEQGGSSETGSKWLDDFNKRFK